MSQLVLLDEHISTQKGFAFKSKWFVDMGREIVKVSDFTSDSIEPNGLMKISEDLGEQYSRYALSTGDVIIQTVGSWPSNPASVVGKAVRVPKTVNGALLNQNAVKIIPRETMHRGFLYYLLRSNDFKEYIIGTAQGAASQASITLDAIKRYKFELPEFKEQVAIAKYLENYDNLIENNNRRIAILEEMAQSLYHEWFVKFRYPSHAKNVDANGNKELIDSPLGQIPEGWNVRELNEFCSKIGSGATPRGGKAAYKKEGIPLIRSMNIYDSTLITKDLAFIDDEQAARLKNVIVEPNDVLLNITGASVARCSIIPSAYTPARVNQHVAIIRFDTDILSAEYLLYTLISKNGKARLLLIAQGGATREALTKADIEKFKIVVPPLEIVKKFNLLAQALVKQKEVLFLKNENLKKQRDMLLPKLIFGEIKL
ncbi:restriction endonuclease subunit S [Moritella sp. 36]|uniref:restriction endonuclease subunit S n=1 Tax=Moritella sp. 36 TaxID=2746233 RepID=UPI001BA80423|nr:restriction endonuclease subunit S [Moritella sp. 36]QUM87426.1 restriction endonuclease subunit S [Moritella sp. 36]